MKGETGAQTGGVSLSVERSAPTDFGPAAHRMLLVGKDGLRGAAH